MNNDLITKTFSPTSIEEVCDAVRAHNHSTIYPVGAGSWMDLGYPRTKPGVEISTLQLNRVVDYPHEELTITVEAGILISELSKILAEKGQMLPIDCPYPEKATLGGLLATNTSGPRRLAYGTARDSVLGLDIVNAEGERIHGGGRVVKNVAGYDMPKMHIGALGTLGIIVEATIKVRPMTEEQAEVEFGVEDGELEGALKTIRESRLRATGVELWSSSNPLNWSLQIFLEGTSEAVSFQRNEATRLAVPLSQRTFDNRGQVAEVVLGASTNWHSDATGDMGVRISVRPTEVVQVMRSLRKSLPKYDAKSHVMNGVVWTVWSENDFDRAKSQIETLRGVTDEFDGRFSIFRCPDPWKSKLPIWGDLGPEIEWMRRLRDSLDPNHVLNPGRFVVE